MVIIGLFVIGLPLLSYIYKKMQELVEDEEEEQNGMTNNRLNNLSIFHTIFGKLKRVQISFNLLLLGNTTFYIQSHTSLEN